MSSMHPTNTAAADLPPCSGPVTTVLIAHTPRTGSSLLATALGDTGLCGRPHEYLNSVHIDQIRLRIGPLPMPSYLAWLKRHRTTANGVFCLKASALQLQQEVVDRGHDPRRLLAPLRCVWIQRRDKVRQAVSYSRALQTDRWRAEAADRQPPHYDYAHIAWSMRFLAGQSRNWPKLFARLGVSPIPVWYLQLAHHYDAMVRGLGAALGLGAAHDLEVQPPRRARMPNAEADAWCARFRVEAVERGMDPSTFGPVEPPL